MYVHNNNNIMICVAPCNVLGKAGPIVTVGIIRPVTRLLVRGDPVTKIGFYLGFFLTWGGGGLGGRSSMHKHTVTRGI